MTLYRHDVPLIVAMVTTLSSLVSAGALSEDCDKHFSRYTTGVTGVFSSPNFPNSYSSLLRCTYYFNPSANGGVEIKFDSFDLEDKKEGDNTCRYDYIDVFAIDSAEVRQRLNRFCGDVIPQTIISPLSKLEIKFVSDHWFNDGRGFNGTYRFLGQDYQPFDHKPSVCGSGHLTGIAGFIYSPNYPNSYPSSVNCSWIINVPENKSVLVRVEDLDIDMGLGDATCGYSALRLYNGYVSDFTLATLDWCGKLSDYLAPDLEHVTSTNRTLIRFVTDSRPRQAGKNGRRGFKLLWMAVTVDEECPDFRCEGGRYCSGGGLCKPLNRYCIPKQLVCDGVYNCGPYDHSDETGCTWEIMIMAACIAVPSLLFVMLVVLVAVLYRNRQVYKSASQEQPLANSNSQGTTSRESFSSNHRQMMVHTSFIDGTGAMTFDPDNDPNNDITDIDQETTHGLFAPSSSNGYSSSLRTHKKRPSYHMMQQSYEDGTMVVAQI
ncbi:hypothetical protein RRG08_038916 [Elysia crispata]|uniref:CUB domain-containing protein n=1 Tax=Elysia crispata TaxID=231223 RepID=A0AAE0Y782_9GAST|nr:hypothetical protein RRG08_038916 [Elysia crispata]